MRHAVCIVVLTVCVAPFSYGMKAYMPPAGVIPDSDLIVTGTVAAVSEVVEKEIKFPGQDKAHKRHVQKAKFKVGGTLRGHASRGDEIEVVFQAPKPRKEGVMMMRMADGPTYPGLKRDETYALALRQFPDANDLYSLPAAVEYFANAVHQNARYNEMCRTTAVEKWAWGETKKGLQVAMLPDRDDFPAIQARTRRGGESRPSFRFQFSVAMRNVGDEPVAVVHHMDFLKLSYQPENGAWHEVASLHHKSLPFDEDKHVTVLQPGELILLARYGKSNYGDHLQVTNPEVGVYAWTAEYSNDKEGETEDGIPYWTGKLKSGIATCIYGSPHQAGTLPPPPPVAE